MVRTRGIFATMVADGNRNREAESRRILDRVAAESDIGSGHAVHSARRPDGVDADDWAEYWGKRIGRMLSMVFIIGMLLWLLLFLVRGG